MSPSSNAPSRKQRGLLPRLFRVGLLGLVVWMLRSQPVVSEKLSVDRVRDFYPAATQLDEPDPQTGAQTVHDANQTVIGIVAQTLPEARDVIGYSGPTNMLIAMDAKKTVIGLRVLHSADTPDHVAEVVSERKFFGQFRGLVMGDLQPKQIDAVTGATLTSSAMAEGVLRKLGKQGPSLRFPEAITLDEVKALEPQAAALRESQPAGVLEVLNSQGHVIAKVLRTAPATDAMIGYKGPSDTLVLLDAEQGTVRGIQLRKSYDTKRYVGYVTGDSYFLNRFNGLSMEKLATLDFKEAKIEGVSGASETSYAIADGLRKRAQKLMEDASPALNAIKQIRWRWQDTGHVLVLLSAFAMAFTKLRGIAWLRHGHHILLVMYAGFVAGELLSQALFAGWAKHGTPWRSAPGLVLLGIVALLGPVVTRRQLYCHHLCPHGALQQLVARRVRWQISLPKWLEHLPFVLLALVLVAVALQLGLDLNALEPFDAYVWKVAGTASLVIACIGLLVSVFSPMAYCRCGCPTGALFKLLRYAGDQDRVGTQDWAALALILGLWLCR